MVLYICNVPFPSQLASLIVDASILGVMVISTIIAVRIWWNNRHFWQFWPLPVFGCIFCSVPLEALIIDATRYSHRNYIVALVVNPTFFVYSVFQIFEITILVYSKRGVKTLFCFNFEKTNDELPYGRLIWARVLLYSYLTFVGAAMIGISITIHDDLLSFPNATSLCYSGPLYYLIARPGDLIEDLGTLENSELVIDILLMISISIGSFIFGLTFWNYGSNYAFGVYSCFFNPWMILFVAGLLAFVALWIPHGFIVVTVLGSLLYVSLVLSCQLVSYEMKFRKNVELYLEADFDAETQCSR